LNRVPGIIQYPRVLERLTGQGLFSLYYNSGAFGFPRDIKTHIVGWIGPEDPSIREAMRPLLHQVPPPYPQSLAQNIITAWRQIGSTTWLMPKSHWAYELDFGNADWLPALLRELQLDPSSLAKLTNAAAIEFALDEQELVRDSLESIFTNLRGSDFALVFPGHPVVCTLHHHQQVWWETTDEGLEKMLRGVLALP
jgi:hypothetical protein